MTYSIEQSTILNAIEKAFSEPNDELIQISAKSGSGKTFMLAESMKLIQPKTGLYLAYNKSIATESQKKFSKNIKCQTTHSLAYRNIVTQLGLKVGFFSYKDIKERIDPEWKLAIVEILDRFFLSDSLSFEDFAGKVLSKQYFDIALKYMQKMNNKSISCTHAFYLKMYHLSLANGILKPKKVDALMLDEAGDINAVTLAIFKLLPAKLKILVGDSHQNIYSFNGTINGFTALKGIGQYYELTQSFRVSSHIAEGVEKFLDKYLEPNTKFKGVNYERYEIDIYSHMYIARTNAAMIDKMIELNERKVKYNLTRPVKVIFELSLILATLKYQGTIYSEKYKFIQGLVDDYYEDTGIQQENGSLMNYILKQNEEDIELQIACNMINRFSGKTIIETYAKALENEKSKSNYPVTISSAHSSKG